MGKFASYFALAPMSQANSAVWPVPYACAQPYNSGSGHSRPQSPSFLGQIKPSGSGDEKGKWRPWRESCFALIATHHHGPMNTALILQGPEGYAILMSLNEKSMVTTARLIIVREKIQVITIYNLNTGFCCNLMTFKV